MCKGETAGKCLTFTGAGIAMTAPGSAPAAVGAVAGLSVSEWTGIIIGVLGLAIQFGFAAIRYIHDREEQKLRVRKLQEEENDLE